ncbi:MAG: Uma2 family endonuclease [Prosthecobacter sp.]
MIDMLESPEMRQSVYRLSVEFYHEAGRLGLLGEDMELLEGVMFRKMPKLPLHEWLSRNLYQLLTSACGEAFIISKGHPITCERSEPEPDLAVFVGSIDDYRERHPSTAELVIEISIGTLQRDACKAAIYAEAGVKEYWLIEPEAGHITLYQDPGADGYDKEEVFPADQEARSELFPAFVLHLSNLLA